MEILGEATQIVLHNDIWFIRNKIPNACLQKVSELPRTVQEVLCGTDVKTSRDKPFYVVNYPDTVVTHVTRRRTFSPLSLRCCDGKCEGLLKGCPFWMNKNAKRWSYPFLCRARSGRAWSGHAKSVLQADGIYLTWDFRDKFHICWLHFVRQQSK